MLQEELEKMLNYKIDQQTTVKQASAVQFVSWCLNKVNGLQVFNADVQKITGLAGGYPGRLMDDDKKIELMQVLEKLGAIKIE